MTPSICYQRDFKLRKGMFQMLRQKGFTLLELIMVMVILGILTATVAPQFIDLQKDARVGVMQSVEGTMLSVANMVYAKSLVAGVERSRTGTVDVNGESITTQYGYPAIGEVLKLVELTPSEDFMLTESSGVVRHQGAASVSTCYVQYVPPARLNAKPSFNVQTSGC